MKEQTHIGNTLDAIAPNKLRYDKNVKELLADVQVLSRIVKYTISEIAHLSVDEIIHIIDVNSIQVSKVPISPGLTNAKLGVIESVQTEDSVLNEGYITYDIRFSLYYNGIWKIIVNVEAQNACSHVKLGYHLENRIQFYIARLISAQKEVEFVKKDYDSIKKVYSIWICMDTENDDDSITGISLQSKTIFGKELDLPELNKMNGIIIKIRGGNDVKDSKNILIAMLEDLLKNEPSSAKKKTLVQKYDIVITEDFERRVDEVCNLSEIVAGKAEEKGRAEGHAEGRVEGREKEKI